MKQYINKNFPFERDLYGCDDIELIDCSFSGKEDGESALKECNNIILNNCYMDLRYPLWHDNKVILNNVHMTENCRASLWYSNDKNGNYVYDENGNHVYTVEFVRLTGVQWGTEAEPLANADFIKSLFKLKGKDDNFFTQNNAYLEGTCYIDELSGADYTEIKERYPQLVIKFNKMTSSVTFKYTSVDADGNVITNPDGTTAVFETNIDVYGENSELCEITEAQVQDKLEAVPAWPENAAFTYEFVGWSETELVSKGINDHENDYLNTKYLDARTGYSLKDIAGDRTLYPVFKAIRKNYTITFINPTAPEGDQIHAVIEAPYGSDNDYIMQVYEAAGHTTPIKLDTADADSYKFIDWYPIPDNITWHFECSAAFELKDTAWHTIHFAEIDKYEYQTGYDTKVAYGYIIKDNNNLEITYLANKSNIAVTVPSEMEVYATSIENPDTVLYNGTYTITCVGGFSSYENLEALQLPNTLVELSSKAFSDCTRLAKVQLPDSLQIIGYQAFNNCSGLTELTIPTSVTSIGYGPFTGCKNLTALTVDNANTKYKIIQGCLVDNNKKLVQGLHDVAIA